MQMRKKSNMINSYHQSYRFRVGESGGDPTQIRLGVTT